MSDVREAVLVRLEAIASESGLFALVARNKKRSSDDRLPACVILDGDEEAEGNDPLARPANAPRRVMMTPEIYLAASAGAVAAGPAINALRVGFLHAVLTDAAMLDILGSNGFMRYLGCATGLAEGRSMLAEMGVSIGFHYMLKPVALA